MNRLAFSGEGAFLHAQVNRFHKAQIGRDKVTAFQHYKITGNKLGGRDALFHPTAHHTRQRA